MCVCVSTHIYIYIHLSLSLCVCIYLPIEKRDLQKVLREDSSAAAKIHPGECPCNEADDVEEFESLVEAALWSATNSADVAVKDM